MLQRLRHLQSTIPGVSVLVFLVIITCLKPSILDDPMTLVALAGGLVAVFYRPMGR
jgi:hypothetical protein